MIATTIELAALQRLARSGTSAAGGAREQLRDLGHVADQAYVAFTYADSHVATARAGLLDGGGADVRHRLDDAASGYDRAVAYAGQAFGSENWTRQVAADRAAIVREAIAAISDGAANARTAADLLDRGAGDADLARRALGRIDLASAVTRR